MSLGESTFTLVPSGGTQRASAATLCRAIVGVGCSPLAAPNALVGVGDPSNIPALLDSGELAEWVAFTARAGQTRYVMPAAPDVAGGVSDVTQVGSGSGAIAVSVAPHKTIDVICSTGGTLGTAAFQFSVDGGAFSLPVVSQGSGPWLYRVPGTYCTLSFSADTYVATKILNVAIDGAVTPGTAWVGTVTQVSSPIDSYEVFVTVLRAGAPGVASLLISLDQGRTALPSTIIPTTGTLVIGGTGLVLTCSSTFVKGETYSFVAKGPTPSDNSLDAAMDALKALKHVQFTQVHLIWMPANVSTSDSLRTGLQASLDDAFNNFQLDWDGMTECPSASGALGYGDVVMDGSDAVRDVDDDDATIIAARGDDSNRVAGHVASYPMISPLTARRPARPLGWAAAYRYVDTDPRDDLSALQPAGPLPIFIPAGLTSIGRDEYETPALDDIQFNTARTYRGRSGVFFSITSGGAGWKNTTQNAAYQDKGFMRLVNSAVARLRPVAQDLIGQRPATNADGTIEERAAKAYDTKFDGALKRFSGLRPGGDFAKPQASEATAQVLRTSQLGQSPKRLDIGYSLRSLGFVSAVANTMTFGGVISVTE
jgi:hypothetical protein